MAGELAPLQTVADHNGASVVLGDLYKSGPIALVFLRHLGCVFCQEQVLALKAEANLKVWFVAMATPEEALAYKTRMGSPHPFLCDPGEDLYRDLGLLNAGFKQMFTPLTLSRGFTAALHGRFNHRSKTNMGRLAGAFVVDTDGVIAWRRPAKEVADIISSSEIAEALKRAAGKAAVGGEGDPRPTDFGVVK